MTKWLVSSIGYWCQLWQQRCADGGSVCLQMQIRKKSQDPQTDADGSAPDADWRGSLTQAHWNSHLLSTVSRCCSAEGHALSQSPPWQLSAAAAVKCTSVTTMMRALDGHTLSRMLLLLLKSVEFDDDVALLLSVVGLVMGLHVTSESEIGSTDSAALRTSWTCLRLCGSCVTS